MTRAADALTLPSGGWYNSSTSSIFASSILPFLGATTYPGIAALDDGSSNNALEFVVNDALSDAKVANLYVAGSYVYGAGAATYTAGALQKYAAGLQNNNLRGSIDGVLGTLNTSLSLPTLSVLRVGARRAGGGPLNGWIQKVKYYPLRVSDTQLQLLTQ